MQRSGNVDRRLVLLALLIAAATAGVTSWLISASGTTLLLFGILFGALALPGYSLAAAHAYDKTPATDVVPIAATILLTNGLGSVVGRPSPPRSCRRKDRVRCSCSPRRPRRCLRPTSSSGRACRPRSPHRERPSSISPPPRSWGRWSRTTRWIRPTRGS